MPFQPAALSRLHSSPTRSTLPRQTKVGTVGFTLLHQPRPFFVEERTISNGSDSARQRRSFGTKACAATFRSSLLASSTNAFAPHMSTEWRQLRRHRQHTTVAQVLITSAPCPTVGLQPNLIWSIGNPLNTRARQPGRKPLLSQCPPRIPGACPAVSTADRCQPPLMALRKAMSSSCGGTHVAYAVKPASNVARMLA